MYTPDEKNQNITGTGDSDAKSSSPVDPSYNPYLEENKPANPAEDTRKPTENTQAPAEETPAEQASDTAKASSWESGAENPGDKKCPHCGGILRDGAKFCIHCGKALHAPQSTQDSYRIPGTAQNDNPPQHPYGAPVPPQDGYRRTPQYTPIDPTVPERLSVLDYFVMFIVTNIPIVGLILALFWGFSSTTGVNRKNFARAILIMRVIQYVLTLLYVLIVVLVMQSGSLYGASLFY